MTHEEELAGARAGDEQAFRRLVEPLRRELLAHCYRLSGSAHDAEDLLQEALLKAWKGLAGFEARSSLRTWIYKVTTHACLDALESRPGRGLPSDRTAANGPPGPPEEEPIWIEPCPPSWYADEVATPEARVSASESVTLAFLAALQLLPPRQRAVLILRDVLGWEASECAELLGSSVSAMNSALQRARETLAARARPSRAGVPPARQDSATRAVLRRYLAAWERADVGELVAILRDDAAMEMPPLPFWIRGAEAIGQALAAMVFTPSSRGEYRGVETEASGRPAIAIYKRDGAGVHRFFALHVVDFEGVLVAKLTAFLDPRLWRTFDLPESLDP